MHEDSRPIILVGKHGAQRLVTAVSTEAARLGLRSGMPATKAQALVPELVIHHADPEADAKALERLAVWALRYSPVIAADMPDGLVMDTAGADHLHGGENAMVADIGRRLRQAGIAARVAISDAWGASHALARFAVAEAVIVPRGNLKIAIRTFVEPIGAAETIARYDPLTDEELTFAADFHARKFGGRRTGACTMS